MYCKKCGSPVTFNQKFCAHCGAQVEGLEKSQESEEVEVISSETVLPKREEQTFHVEDNPAEETSIASDTVVSENNKEESQNNSMPILGQEEMKTEETPFVQEASFVNTEEVEPETESSISSYTLNHTNMEIREEPVIRTESSTENVDFKDVPQAGGIPPIQSPQKPAKNKWLTTILPIGIAFAIIAAALIVLFVLFKPDTTLDGDWECIDGENIHLKSGKFEWNGKENTKAYTTKGSFSIQKAEVKDATEAEEKGYKFYYGNFKNQSKTIDGDKKKDTQTVRYKVGMGTVSGKDIMLLQNETTSAMHFCYKSEK